METKICTKCGIKKTIDKFYKSNHCKFGVRGDCKECLRIPHIIEILPEGHKKCTNCKEIKLFDSFNKDKNKKFGLSGWCKKCRYPEIPKEVFPENHKRCTICEEIKSLDKFFNDKSKSDNKSCRCKECIRQWNLEHEEEQKQWVRDNIEDIKKYRNKWHKIKYDSDPLFKLSRVMRTMLKRTFNLIGTKKEGRTKDELGYPPEKLKLRMDVNFTDGMSHDNYPEWEIDHIIPIDYFIKKGVTDPKIINALSNLKPRWKTSRTINGVFYLGNIEKGNKLIY